MDAVGDQPISALPVFADVDTGVDDALALVYLLASDDAELVGIASTGGNVAVQQVCRNNLGLLELCEATGVPVSKGADSPLRGSIHTAENIHGPQGLGYAGLTSHGGELTGYDAAAAWARAAREHPGQLVGLVTGPLTNLALALRVEPALPGLLRRLVIMGGAFDPGRARPEFNISVDPEAAAEVFTAWGTRGARVPQRLPVVCGLELTQHIAMTPAILDRLAAASPSSPLIRVLGEALRFYFEAHDERGHGYLAYLHDPLAAAIALDPELASTRPAVVRVELTGPGRGRTVADWSGEPNARIGVGVDPRVFFDRYVERVGSFARRLN